MALDEIKARVQALQGETAPSPENASLQARAEHAWRNRILTELNDIFEAHSEDEAACMAACETLLKYSFELTKGTSLTYTAQPHSDITTLLINVAAEVAASKEDSNALSVLMPGVFQESISDDYPSLDTLPVEQILNTYVLSDSATYLYPVKLLTELQLIRETDALSFNPYFDYLDNPENVRLDRGAYGRIEAHSALTEAMMDAKKKYNSLTAEQGSLLAQLTLFLNHLELNSVNYRGEEKNAAEGAYPTIINFNEYYKNLPAAEKRRIPWSLKTAIEILLNFASNPEANINATETTETCIALRRTAILDAMQGHNELLGQITIGEAQQAGLIEASQEQFETAKRELTDAISGSNYDGGKDKLGITQALLHTLDVDIRIHSPNDLKLFVDGLMPDEIVDILSDSEVKAQIMRQLSSIENLVLFIIETPADKLTVFLTQLENEISPLIRRPKDLAALFISLEVEKVQVTLEALILLAERANLLGNYSWIVGHLSPNQKRAVFEVIKRTLPKLFNSHHTFIHIMHQLEPEERLLLLSDEAIKVCMAEVITSSEKFHRLIAALSSEESAHLFSNESIRVRLPAFINNAYELQRVIKGLTHEQLKQLLLDTDLVEKMPTFITSDVAFNYLMEELETETLILLSPLFIDSAETFNQIMNYLTLEERIRVLDDAALMKQLPGFIDSAKTFTQVMRHLSHEQREQVLLYDDALIEELPEFIDSAETFNWVMACLEPEQRTNCFNAMGNRLSAFILSSENSEQVQENTAFNVLKKILLQFVKFSWDFSEALQPSPPKDSTLVFDDTLSNPTQFAENLKNVLAHLTPEQIEQVTDALKEKLPAGFKLEKILTTCLPEPNITISIREKLSDIQPPDIQSPNIQQDDESLEEKDEKEDSHGPQ